MAVEWPGPLCVAPTRGRPVTAGHPGLRFNVFHLCALLPMLEFLILWLMGSLAAVIVGAAALITFEFLV